MTKVRVDFNSRGPSGTVRGSRRRADGPFDLGDVVELYDPDEPDRSFAATVVGLDPDSGAAHFDVDWLREAPEGERQAAVFGIALTSHFGVAFAGISMAERTGSGDALPARDGLIFADRQDCNPTSRRNC